MFKIVLKEKKNPLDVDKELGFGRLFFEEPSQ
jgi:hypothetical protein